MTADANQNILEAVDRFFGDEVQFLRRLIQIPSENPPGMYEEVASFIDSFARQQGLKSRIMETPPDVCRLEGVEGGKRLNEMTMAGERSKPKVLLLAHLDTVPAGDKSTWVHEPFGGEIAEGKIYGRGACDCKGRIAAYLFAQLALTRTLDEIPGKVMMAATADEEIGGKTGARYLLERGDLTADFCIGEGYTREVFNGFKGLLWVRMSVQGKSAHGATPHLGVSAIEPLQDFLLGIREFQGRLHSDSTLNIGLVRGGTKINMVPDSATVEIDMRLGEGDEVEKALDELQLLAERTQRRHANAAVKLEVLNRSDPISIASDHPLVTIVRSNVQEVTGSDIPVRLWFAHSDTAHFLKKGIPSVNYGVGRAGIAHMPDEHIYLDDLKVATKAVAMSVLKLLGGETAARKS